MFLTATTTQALPYGLTTFFPAWFLNRKIHFSLTNRHNSGPEQALRVIRIVPSTSDIIKFAMQGDVQQMKDFPQNGQGSPYDTDGTNTPPIVRVPPHSLSRDVTTW